jgi:tetratricopeptide (TPR) repeat protein
LTLSKLGRNKDAINVYDDLLVRFATATDLPLRECVANALNNKGLSLTKLNRRKQAITVYDLLLKEFKTATDLPLRECVARAEQDREKLARKEKRANILGNALFVIFVMGLLYFFWFSH